jgi:AcrR family transcriptional regulator
MTAALRSRQPAAEDTKARIMEVAEEHFRRVGYAKTAVADIAGALGMSPANVYRYFPSKLAINEAICSKLMETLQHAVRSIAQGPGKASQRIEAMILAIHRTNKAMLIEERRIFDMVEVAMAENWGAIEAHCDCMRSLFAAVVADGAATGEFGATDAAEAGRFVFNASVGLFHPTLLSQCADHDLESEAKTLIRYILRALQARAA